MSSQPLNPTDPQPNTVRHLPAHRRFELATGDGSTAFLSYRLEGHCATFDHTFVPPAARGLGLAAQLVQAGLEEARRQRWRVIPECSYVATFLQRHSHFADLVAKPGDRNPV